MRAARAAGMPVMISFTVETDGRLPTGPTLREAIETVDAETDAAPAYYMINCAHPTHFRARARAGRAHGPTRIGALRANSSAKSHAELNESPTLDEGNPVGAGQPVQSTREEVPPLPRARRLLRHRLPPRPRDRGSLHELMSWFNRHQI